MNCKECKNFLADHHDKLLELSVHNEVTAHLGACSSCSEELAFLKKYKKALGTLSPRKAPKNFLGQVRERLERPRRFKRIFQTLFVPLKLKLPLEAAGLLALSFFVMFLLKPQFQSDQHILPLEEVSRTNNESMSPAKARVSKKRIATSDIRKPVAGMLKTKMEPDHAEKEITKSAPKIQTYRIALVFVARNKIRGMDDIVAKDRMMGSAVKEESSIADEEDRKDNFRVAQKSKKADRKPPVAMGRKVVPDTVSIDSVRNIASSPGCRIIREIVDPKTNKPRTIIVEISPGSYREFVRRLSRVGTVQKRGTALPAKIERKSSIRIDLVE